MKLLVVDNYDSFTYNLVHMLESLLHQKVDIQQNDQVNLMELDRYEKIVLSPGPGLPEQAGSMLDIIRHYAPQKSILGVCLGHQAIGMAFGAQLKNLPQVFHGVASPLDIKDKEHPLFHGIPNGSMVGRYHSWVVDPIHLPACLKVIASDQEGNIMGLQHRDFNVCSVQFHPESVMTAQGKEILGNWLRI